VEENTTVDLHAETQRKWGNKADEREIYCSHGGFYEELNL